MSRRAAHSAASASAEPLLASPEAVVHISVLTSTSPTSAASSVDVAVILDQARPSNPTTHGTLVNAHGVLLLLGYSADRAMRLKTLEGIFRSAKSFAQPQLINVKVGKVRSSSWLWLEDAVTVLIAAHCTTPAAGAVLVGHVLTAIEAFECRLCACAATRATLPRLRGGSSRARGSGSHVHGRVASRSCRRWPGSCRRAPSGHSPTTSRTPECFVAGLAGRVSAFRSTLALLASAAAAAPRRPLSVSVHQTAFERDAARSVSVT